MSSIEKCEVKAGSTITFDNLFTSLPLLDELTELGIGALGTLQQNCFHVANKTTLANKPRGSYDFATDGNKVVTCATIYIIRTVQKQKIGMLEFLREAAMAILAYIGTNKAAKAWRFHEILQAM